MRQGVGRPPDGTEMLLIQGHIVTQGRSETMVAHKRLQGKGVDSARHQAAGKVGPEPVRPQWSGNARFSGVSACPREQLLGRQWVATAAVHEEP